MEEESTSSEGFLERGWLIRQRARRAGNSSAKIEKDLQRGWFLNKAGVARGGSDGKPAEKNDPETAAGKSLTDAAKIAD